MMKIKLTAVDVFLICITLIVVFFLGYRIARNNTEIAESKQQYTVAEVTIRAEVRKEYYNNISVGDTLIDSESGLFIGHVSKIEYTDHIIHHSTTGSDMEHPEILLVDITFTTSMNNGSYSVFPVSRIVIGQEYALSSPNLFFKGTCMSVEETEEEFGGIQPR